MKSLRNQVCAVLRPGVAAQSAAAAVASSYMHLAVRLWIAFLGLYELPLIVGNLRSNKQPFSGFSSNLVPNPAEKRVWAFVLALLSISRFVAAAWPTSPAALCNLAAVHTAEAIFMCSEKLCYDSKRPFHMLAVIVANAVGFCLLAMMAS